MIVYFDASALVKRYVEEEGSALVRDLLTSEPIAATSVISLLELPNVRLRRRERITCNEEERLREGYELQVTYRFAPPESGQRLREADVVAGGQPLLRLLYAPAATIAYINHGWKYECRPQGFLIDLDSGELLTDSAVETPRPASASEATPPESLRLWVWETQDLLLVRFLNPELRENDVVQTSLQYALQRGIEQTFQLEERELGVARLGEGPWKSLLFYEAAEGSLGVLRRLMDEPSALSEVAQSALAICHYNPDGTEQARACQQACYECLLSYTNQLEANLLNRQAIRDLLQQLTACQVQPRLSSHRSEERRSYEEHLAYLRARTQSALERNFLEFLEQHGYRLPADAQKSLAEPRCIADFFYQPNVLVFCDGPPHDTSHQRRIDEQQRRELVACGYRVVVIRWDQDFHQQVRAYPEIFGLSRTARPGS
ncbi:Zn-binding domain-containing protein [Thermogemmata fonticola]|uniref:DUF1998 domain-containing protein n=1 Tax=Thermogemmata fonticola TaxID=2755323 RepID=A0A7V8VEV3_9BACT|nr:Zn-binding domain-containing protein [Thermogemmata fonticola]MBA2226667.1 DUF1998 domain-containing protein [Thermogemmata fonticola]